MDAITLSGQELDRLLGAADPDAALLFLYIKSQPVYDAGKAARALGYAPERLALKEALLRQLGLLAQPVGGPLETEAPNYTQQDVTNFLKRDNQFYLLVGEAQRRLGRILSNESLKTLLAIYDYLGLPTDVIGLLIGYCIQRAQARGNSNPPTMRTIEKEAALWSGRGIDTMALAARYVQEQDQKQTRFGQFRQAMGLSGKLSGAEERYLNQWVDMGFSLDAIELAYEKTRLSTGGLKWSYMNKILTDWDAKGLHTAQAAAEETHPGQAGERGNSGGTQTGGAPAGETRTRHKSQSGTKVGQSAGEGELDYFERQAIAMLQERMKHQEG